jgi:hypothetical protein
MMKGIAVAFLAIFAAHLWSSPATSGEPPEITVAVQGVRIVKPSPDGDDMLRAFNGPIGTSVALVVSKQEGGLVAFDGDASRVKTFVDDTGKDLTKHEPEAKSEMLESLVFPPGWNVSKDCKHCSLDVIMPGIPTKKATTLALSGTLVFRVAKEKKDYTTEDVTLRAGSQVNAANIPLTIKYAGKPRFGGDGKSLEIEFHAKQKLDAIIGIKFFDAAGKRIEAEEDGRGVVTSLDGDSAPSAYDATISYRLKDAVNAAKIVITCWTDMREVTVQFDLKAGLGL